MKNSLKFLTAAGLLLLGSLTAYNAALSSEYRLGAYKNPLHNYTLLPQRDFSTVHLPAAGMMQVRVEAGPFGVYVNKRAADYVRVSQQGAQLTVALNFPKEKEYLGPGDAVLIRCPRLTDLTAGSTYTLAGRTIRPRRLTYSSTTTLQGFAQDSLRLVQDDAAQVALAHNRLGNLQAVVGQNPGSTAQLEVNPTNVLRSASIRVDKQGRFVGENVALPAVRWQLGDSARVELSGAALKGVVR
ncbi:hypothetical protein ACFQT0_10860 [Hymenobacter humi]|uniref:DUF2807 domain-containing protein n=1 Tax=Hymenobacter humi TaxID=1411620 RepID=A0ABW2U4Q2_9BACT